MDTSTLALLDDDIFLTIIWSCFQTSANVEALPLLLHVCKRWHQILTDPNTIPVGIGPILNPKMILTISRVPLHYVEQPINRCYNTYLSRIESTLGSDYVTIITNWIRFIQNGNPADKTEGLTHHYVEWFLYNLRDHKKHWCINGGMWCHCTNARILPLFASINFSATWIRFIFCAMFSNTCTKNKVENISRITHDIVKEYCLTIQTMKARNESRAAIFPLVKEINYYLMLLDLSDTYKKNEWSTTTIAAVMDLKQELFLFEAQIKN